MFLACKNGESDSNLEQRLREQAAGSFPPFNGDLSSF